MRNDNNINNDKIDSWMKRFQTRKSAPMIDYFHKTKFSRLLTSILITVKCRNQLEKQYELAFLISTDLGKGTITIIHHCKEIGEI